MIDSKEIQIIELKRLAKECRFQAKGRRPDISLMRIGASLESIIASFENHSLGPQNPWLTF